MPRQFDPNLRVVKSTSEQRADHERRALTAYIAGGGGDEISDAAKGALLGGLGDIEAVIMEGGSFALACQALAAIYQTDDPTDEFAALCKDAALWRAYQADLSRRECAECGPAAP